MHDERKRRQEDQDTSSCKKPKATDELPAAAHRLDLLEALAAHQVVICIGETGSGKTTQLPQYLDAVGCYTRSSSSSSSSNQNHPMIGITQPRRVATIAVAQRVAHEMNVASDSGIVAHAIRFDDRTTPDTRIKFMTDGILVRECLRDPLLSKYSVIMLDEAHERSIHTDILFGLLKKLVQEQKRPDLKILVTSATLDAKRLSGFFSNGTNIQIPVIKIPGRSYPVDIFHSKTMQIMGRHGPLSTYVRAAVETTLQIHNSEPSGHILVFLTGQQEIEDACAQIRALYRQQEEEDQASSHMRLQVYPLYGALHGHLQQSIFESVPSNVRKVIVATNIAETSLTIDGIRYVIDAGFTKQKVYDPNRQMESLVIVPISKVSAQQRAGRGGRTAAGKCFRLYSKASYDQMMDETIPEIKRTNLTNTILYLKVLGIQDVENFDYVDPPSKDAIVDALKQLRALGALNGDELITPLGEWMSQFPLEPKLSRCLIESLVLGCGQEMTSIVAILSMDNVFVDHHIKYKQRDKRWQRQENDQEKDPDKDDDTSAVEKRLRRLQKEGLLDEEGDPLTYGRILQAFQNESKQTRQRQSMQAWCEERSLRYRSLTMAQTIQQQLQDICRSIQDERKFQAYVQTKQSDPISRSDRVRKALTAGFYMHAARRVTAQSCVYRPMEETNDFQLLHVHPTSTLQILSLPDVCIYHQLVQTSKPFMRHVLRVKRQWIQEYDVRPKTKAMDNEGTKAPAVPPMHQPPTKPIEKNDAVAAARARFLMRKQQQTKSKR